MLNGLNGLAVSSSNPAPNAKLTGFEGIGVSSSNPAPNATLLGFKGLGINDEIAWTVIVQTPGGTRVTNAILDVSNLVNSDSYQLTGFDGVNGTYRVSVFTDWIVNGNGQTVSDGLLDTVIDVSAVGYESSSATITTPDGFGGTLIITLGIKAKMLTKTIVSFPPVIETPVGRDYCICDFGFCEYEEKALVDIANADTFRNDTSSFLVTSFPSQTVAFELYKDGVKVANLNDDSYGTYYPSFTANELLAGYVADWRSIVLAFGFGRYRVAYTLDGDDAVYSRYFRTLPYDAIGTADQTIRMEVVQDGNIINGIDYTGLVEGGWVQQYRIEGELSEVAPETVNEVFLTSSYNNQQQQTFIREKYSLQLKFVPDIVWRAVKEGLTGNEIRISDYNYANPKIFRNVSVMPEGVGALDKYPNNLNYTVQIDFMRRPDDFRKQNF